MSDKNKKEMRQKTEEINVLNLHYSRYVDTTGYASSVHQFMSLVAPEKKPQQFLVALDTSRCTCVSSANSF